MTDPTAVVTGLFNQVLRTNPTTEELGTYLGVLRLTGVNGVVAGLLSSTEFKQTQVNNYYLEMLKRPATAGELALESSALMWGLPEPLIAVGIARSKEFYQAGSAGGTSFGVQPTATTYVQALYRTLLGQQADPAVLPVYVQNIQGGQPLFFAATQFITSDAFRQVKVQEVYSVLGETPTEQELTNYVRNWFFKGGIYGIAAGLLATSGNIQHIETGQVVLPDMAAAAQLQQLLLAPYIDGPDGFVAQYQKLVGDCSDTSAPACVNPALYSLIVNGGAQRGIPNSAMQVKGITATVATLIPTQNEINLALSLRFPLTDPTTLETDFKGGVISPFGSPVVTADNGAYIVDGHHRWSAIYLINPSAQVDAIDIGYVPTPQDALLQSQMGIAAQNGKLTTSVAGSPNVYDVSRSDFNAFVETTINNNSDPTKIPLIYGVFQTYLGYSNTLSQAEQLPIIQNYLWGNVLRMRANNPFVPNAPSRVVMPQLAPLQPILQYLQGGTLSYSFPIISYIG